MPPLEIQVFSPSSTQSSPSRARARGHRRDVGAGVGLGQRERGDRLAARDRAAASARCCASLPASVIAPLPRPCIAKAKSARPSWQRERLAHDAQRARIERRQRAAVAPPARSSAASPASPSARTQRAAGGVDVGVRRRPRAPAARRPRARARAASARCASVEERPVEVGAVHRPRRPAASVALELRRLLRHERLVGAPEVLRSACRSPAPAPRPRSPRRGPSPTPGAAASWSSPCANVGPSASARASACASASSASAATSRLKKPHARALVRRHRAAGVEQLGGAALADHARQQRAGAHVAAGEADAHEQERGLRRGRAEAQVGRQRDHRARRRRRCRRPRRRSAAGSARIAFTRSPVMRVNAAAPASSSASAAR